MQSGIGNRTELDSIQITIIITIMTDYSWRPILQEIGALTKDYKVCIHRSQTHTWNTCTVACMCMYLPSSSSPPPCTNTCMRTHTHARAHTCMHTYIHSHTHTHMQAHIKPRTHANTRMHTHMHAHTHACTHTHTHMHVHTHTHTHTHMHTHTKIPDAISMLRNQGEEKWCSMLKGLQEKENKTSKTYRSSKLP